MVTKLLFPTARKKVDKLQSGDLVFRTGSGFVSDFARNFSRYDKRFSHVGILFKQGNMINVTHSINEEEKHYNGVVTEPLADFLNAASNWAVYRLPLTRTQKARFISATHKYARQKIPFDSQFDLGTSQNFYCTELIWHALKQASPDKELINNRTILAGRPFISIDDLYRNGHAQLIDSLH